MIYVYCFLISLATILLVFLGLFLLMRWALPRYGMRAMRMVMQPPTTPTFTVTGGTISPPHQTNK